MFLQPLKTGGQVLVVEPAQIESREWIGVIRDDDFLLVLVDSQLLFRGGQLGPLLGELGGEPGDRLIRHGHPRFLIAVRVLVGNGIGESSDPIR